MARRSANPETFVLRSTDFQPSYLALHHSGELKQRAERAVAAMASCDLCGRSCGVDRLSGRWGVCRTGRYARVASWFPHHGEERCLSGWNGSGAIFFSMCSLHCVFCQNAEISSRIVGEEVAADRLADMMLDLQESGCHNINWVTPSHVIPQALEALDIAAARGLRLPIVYNTGGYDTLEALRLLDGVVDIYLPDFKFWKSVTAKRYLRARDYPEVARTALREMHRQVGPLMLNEDGIALRGLLVRHLVMPRDTASTRLVLRFLARELGTDTCVNVMHQYRPDGLVGPEDYPEINRRLTAEESEEANETAQALGLRLV